MYVCNNNSWKRGYEFEKDQESIWEDLEGKGKGEMMWLYCNNI